MGLGERNCIESNVYAITGGFLQLLDDIGILVLCKREVRESRQIWEENRKGSTYIKDNVRPDVLDELKVVRRRDRGNFVTRKLSELNSILAN